jgi:hypothetical protein
MSQCNYCTLEEMMRRWKETHKGQRLKVVYKRDPLPGSTFAGGVRIVFNGEDQGCWFAALTKECAC